ncbi:TPA: integrating conjugative element protein [Vibrio parahaemolyticus]|uniref:integrating conjugative element protein n=1 Tax=Vibrio owensii TaxID=696485 RepID=UPI0018F1F2DC|nr:MULTISPECIES: integrating conjugative element protein [Vibrio harveyi group]UPR19076.1 integrating conjugative element protein [Vibrio parahaemolyticus]HAV1520144.1 integrating conjugative element protein [Vibrio parahaemolyticus]HAV1539111.1 integrating conjugative element protein [Vibrio parahaemolyticus]
MKQLKVKFLVLCLLSSTVSAESTRDRLEPILENGPWYYEVGGARYVPLTKLDNTRVSAGAGIRWNGNLMCSNLDPSVSIDAFMNGAKEGFINLQRNAVNTFKGVIASLPGLALQHADPGLYELLSTGFIQAEELFNIELANCRQVTRDLATSQPNYEWVKASGFGGLSNVFNRDGAPISSVNKDAGILMDDTEENAGREGVDWVCGEKAGGDGQDSIKSSDIVLSSFNQLAGRDSCDTSSVSVTDSSPLHVSHWDSPQSAKQWFIDVVGDVEVNTTPSKKPIDTKIGTGLMPKIEETFKDVSDKMDRIVTSSQPPTLNDLRAVSFTDVLVSRSMVESLRRDPQGRMLAQRLALDISLQREMMRALTMRRMLMSGKDIEVVSALEPSQKMVNDAIERLSKEIRIVREEIEIRRELLSSTAPFVLQRDQNRQTTVIEGMNQLSLDKVGN